MVTVEYGMQTRKGWENGVMEGSSETLRVGGRRKQRQAGTAFVVPCGQLVPAGATLGPSGGWETVALLVGC